MRQKLRKNQFLKKIHKFKTTNLKPTNKYLVALFKKYYINISRYLYQYKIIVNKKKI